MKAFIFLINIHSCLQLFLNVKHPAANSTEYSLMYLGFHFQSLKYCHTYRSQGLFDILFLGEAILFRFLLLYAHLKFLLAYIPTQNTNNLTTIGIYPILHRLATNTANHNSLTFTSRNFDICPDPQNIDVS